MDISQIIEFSEQPENGQGETGPDPRNNDDAGKIRAQGFRARVRLSLEHRKQGMNKNCPDDRGAREGQAVDPKFLSVAAQPPPRPPCRIPASADSTVNRPDRSALECQ
jgi:hypothetical protein